jgi:hypothetical protein
MEFVLIFSIPFWLILLINEINYDNMNGKLYKFKNEIESRSRHG